MPEAEVAGGVLPYWVDGAREGPWLVLANSLLTDHRLWEPQLDTWTRSLRVLRYDQRGHGRSRTSPSPAGPAYGFDLLAADLVSVMDHAGVDAAHLLGISMGGSTVATLAARHPDRARSVTLCDCRTASNPASADEWTRRRQVARRGGLVGLARESVERWFPEDGTPRWAENRERVGRMAVDVGVEGYCASVATLADYDVRHHVDALGSPLALVAGRDDGDRPRHFAELAATLPDARSVVIADAGHLSNLDQPEAFAAVVLDLLADWGES